MRWKTNGRKRARSATKNLGAGISCKRRWITNNRNYARSATKNLRVGITHKNRFIDIMQQTEFTTYTRRNFRTFSSKIRAFSVLPYRPHENRAFSVYPCFFRAVDTLYDVMSLNKSCVFGFVSHFRPFYAFLMRLGAWNAFKLHNRLKLLKNAYSVFDQSRDQTEHADWSPWSRDYTRDVLWRHVIMHF